MPSFLFIIAKNIFMGVKHCMISFKANLIQPVLIERMSQSVPASFVELDNASKQDLKTLRQVSRSWDNGKTYAWDVYNFFSCQLEDDEQRRYFAITTQKQSLENLDSNRVLGVAQMMDEKEHYLLEFLQVDPENNFSAFYRIFKGVGAAMLTVLKTLFNDKDIFLRPANQMVSVFYEKQNFEFLKETRYMRLKR